MIVRNFSAQTRKAAEALAPKLPEHVPGEVIVKLKPDTASLTDFADEYGSKVLHKFAMPQTMVASVGGEMLQLKLPEGVSTAEGIAALRQDSRVAYAVTNDILHRVGEPVVPDDLDPRLWGLNNTGQDNGTLDADIDAPEAWAVTTGKNQGQGGPLIAVIDTGVDYNHPDLKANMWTNPGEVPGDGIDNDGNGVIDDLHGYNATNDSGDPMDDNDHGTHCAGTIGGHGNNAEGVAGVQWNANMMGVKFLTAGGSGNLADAVKGILYAERMGARITSNSWGGGGYNEALRDALANSHALHIFAAGNNGNDNDAGASYPASYDLPNIVAVAASDRNDNLADFSNYGRTTVDLAAPGVDVWSARPGGGYQNMSGTSMATPHVSGAAGLILAQYPDLNNDQLKARLLNSVDRLPNLHGTVLTGGRLNVANALENDSVAPGAPEVLKGSSDQAGVAVVAWTAQGDDGLEGGRAAYYDLRRSDQPFGEGPDETTFAAGHPVPAPTPGQPGTAEEVSVKMPLSSEPRTYYFGLQVGDNVGNLSEIRTTSVTVPAASLAFEENCESETVNFTGEGWAKVPSEGRGLVWTDSPDGPYNNHANTSLTSKVIDLSRLANSTLVFDAKIATEARYDFLHVEAREPGAEKWTRLAKFDGNQDWAAREVDMRAFDGKSVELRFRLQSDNIINGDGVYLDNIVIAGAPVAPPEPPPEPPQR